jgi:hypothetical protein
MVMPTKLRRPVSRYCSYWQIEVAGWFPMKLDNWRLVTHNRHPGPSPESRLKRLYGKVFGHPHFDDGYEMTTSLIVGVREGRVVTQSGPVYELGAPADDYEALFPDARQRLLAAIATTEESCA